MKNPLCPICNSQKTEFYFTHKGFSKPFDIYSCKDCQGNFQFPLPSQQELQKYYQENYFSGKANFSYIDERKNFKGSQYVWNSRLNNILKYKKGGNFLDIGCSFGGFTLTASQWFYSYGLDLSDYAVKEGNAWAKKKNVNKNFKGLFQGSLKKIPKEILDIRFDVITLVEVIEHLENPREEIQALFELLKEDGMLLIQTANFEGWQAIKTGKNYHYFLPGHLTYFTDKGLKKMLSDLGFKSYKTFYPVDFSLWAKFKKSQTSFKRPWHYFRWLKIAFYHLTGKLFYKGKPLQSSYVLYAFKY